ncbi:MAG: N-acyl amino acid synthase FeeM domain-containing protein, partial [Deltaproteobacteria bacterium]
MNGIKKHLIKTVNLLIRKAIGLLPRKIRYEVFRNRVSIPSNNPEIIFKLAQTQSELEQAFQILHDAYVGSGFMKAHPSGMRITPYHALPSTSTLIATRDNKVIATVSIIRDSGLGLPLESIFNIKELKEKGRRVAEISSLAIHHSYRGNNGEVLFPLLKYLYRYCVNFFGVDYMVIAVNPSRSDFYEAVLFFQRITSQIVAKYDFVQGAPALGAYLDLRLFYQTLATYYGNKKESKNFFNFFTGDIPSNFVYPDRQYYKITDPVMTPEMLNYFFNQKTE